MKNDLYYNYNNPNDIRNYCIRNDENNLPIYQLHHQLFKYDKTAALVAIEMMTVTYIFTNFINNYLKTTKQMLLLQGCLKL